MSAGHVLDPRLPGDKMPFAFHAVMVVWTLCVVLPSRVFATKVEVAIVAGPVRDGILFVLL
jgi:hypothetical protein